MFSTRCSRLSVSRNREFPYVWGRVWRWQQLLCSSHPIILNRDCAKITYKRKRNFGRFPVVFVKLNLRTVRLNTLEPSVFWVMPQLSCVFKKFRNISGLIPVAGRGSAAARFLRLRVRFPPGAWTFVCCECCALSGRVLCDSLDVDVDLIGWVGVELGGTYGCRCGILYAPMLGVVFI